jgi:hypothetical protein
MSHGPEHHIEHAEHAAHAAHDPFDTRVILSITILAALLAAVTLLSHRAHNATLRLQMEAANQWNYFQAKKNRMYLYETADAETDLLLAMPLPDNLKTSKDYKTWQDEAKERKTKSWKQKAKQYRSESDQIEAEANELTHQAHGMHGLGDLYDTAELGVEIGLVLSSLAILTRRRGFWYGGLACSFAGVIVALVGLYQQFVVLAAHH